MSINILLAAIEEYLEIKRSGATELEELDAASQRFERAFREACQSYFDRAIFEDRRRTSSITTKVDVIHPNEAAYTWDDILQLTDALSNAPVPLKKLDNQEDIILWMKVYAEWFREKRKIAIKPIKQKLEIDLDDLSKKIK